MAEGTLIGRGGASARIGWIAGGVVTGYVLTGLVSAIQLLIAAVLPGYERLSHTSDAIVDVGAAMAGAVVACTLLLWLMRLEAVRQAAPRVALWAVGALPLLLGLLYLPDAIRGFYAPLRSPAAVVIAVGLAVFLSGRRLQNPGMERTATR